MRTINRDVVSAVILSKDDRLLLALRDPRSGSVYPSCWSLVGGGVEPGEMREDALIREVREEIGVDVSSYHAEFIDEADGQAEKTLKNTGEVVLCNMTFYTYKIVIDDKEANEIAISLNNEHSEYRWVDPSELKGLRLTPPSANLFAKLGYL